MIRAKIYIYEDNGFKKERVEIMREKKKRLAETWILGIMMAVGMVMAAPPVTAHAEEAVGEWREEGGNLYWYENGVKQGTEGRGKEIYDPGTDAWYWLDAVDGGRMAKNKDVYLESWGGQYADRADGTGKWVRYDGNGHMVKGWDSKNETYYFDPVTGAMAKGLTEIDGKQCAFTEIEGYGITGWIQINGGDYYYEDGVRLGTEYGGQEIYDKETDSWYYLDAAQDGKKAVNKDVYQRSEAGPWAEDKKSGCGKWVRYDKNGRMVKGWDTDSRGRYYFDPTYGTMAKGKVVIDGKTFWFDNVTGILGREIGDAEGGIIDEEIKHKGMDGSIEWILKKDGELVILGVCGEEQKNGWENAGWLAYKNEITGAYVDFTGAVSLRGLFAGLEKLQYVKNLEKLDTSQVTDMSKMFYDCIRLESLNLGGFDTSKVTDMSNMFYDCRNLQSLDLKNFNTGNVTNMSGMFGGTYDIYDQYWNDLEYLDVSSFDTSKVTDMSYMFRGRHNLNVLDVSSFDTSKVTNMSCMFYGCGGLQSDGFVGFDTSNVTNMEYMFGMCAVSTLDLSSFDTRKVTDSGGMFYVCFGVKIFVGDNWNISVEPTYGATVIKK